VQVHSSANRGCRPPPPVDLDKLQTFLVPTCQRKLLLTSYPLGTVAGCTENWFFLSRNVAIVLTHRRLGIIGSHILFYQYYLSYQVKKKLDSGVVE
jgi:hypothetical protein